MNAANIAVGVIVLAICIFGLYLAYKGENKEAKNKE
jgi:hypothetical protein